MIFPISRPKTEFGWFLEEYDIKQEWLAVKSKTSQGLISQLVVDENRIPKRTTAARIIKVLRKFEDVDIEDFWDFD